MTWLKSGRMDSFHTKEVIVLTLLPGPAKAIDMHRLETKLELLLAQVLANTSSTAAGRSHRSSTYSLQTLFSAAGLSRESHGFASRMAAAAAATLGDDDKSATAKNVKRSCFGSNSSAPAWFLVSACELLRTEGFQRDRFGATAFP